MLTVQKSVPKTVALNVLRKFARQDSKELLELPPSFIKDDVEVIDLRKFVKSGLLPQHRNVLQNNLPYQQANSWIHFTEKYQRKMFGRYGAQSNFNPKICFKTKRDYDTQNEKQKIADIVWLQEAIKKYQNEKKFKLNAIRAREEDVAKKIEKLDQWKADLNAKIAKKESEALVAKERKERLIEEVRRHFGFKVDTRDDRFKQLLEQKDKEDKRRQKEAKRKAKEEKMMVKLVEKSTKL